MSRSVKISTGNMILSAMFTAITCVLSQIVIPIHPVPFSLSLLAIYLTGAFLKPKYALLSAFTYILLGIFGLPVFAGFKGGSHVLIGMTGGFLMAYPLMALITSITYKYTYKLTFKSKHMKSVAHMVLPASGMIAALFVCYITGTLWFCYVAGAKVSYALSVCVLPFIPFDIIKILMAVITAAALKKVCPVLLSMT